MIKNQKTMVCYSVQKHFQLTSIHPLSGIMLSHSIHCPKTYTYYNILINIESGEHNKRRGLFRLALNITANFQE